MKTYFNKTSCLALATVMAAGIPSQVRAQDTEGAAEDNSGIIVVTARNREENIQSVPLAITAFSEEDIARQSIQELDDVARFTPGFTFEDFSGGFAQPTIRGQATARITALESNVSAFYDGIYIPRSWAVDLGTANLQRIEVVKGPQSARYGRNAFSGAINYLPKKAALDGEISGEIEATVGIDERRDIGAFINFAVSDNFALAASYDYSSYDGSWENSHPFANADIPGPSTKGNVGGWENQSVSISAIAELSPGFTVEASYNYFDVQNEARASNYLAEQTGDGNCGNSRSIFFAPATLPLICGELPAPGDTTLNDPRGYGAQAETGIFRFNANLEITDSLTIDYTFGNVNGDVDIATSGEPDPINCGTLVGPPAFDALCNFQNAPIGDIDYDTHELRIVFDNGGPIRGAIGGFLSDGVDNFRFNSLSLPVLTAANLDQTVSTTPVPVGGAFQPGAFGITLQDATTTTEVVSIFGEVQWTSADGATRIGAEGRYSETEVTTDDNRRTLTLNDTFKVFTPRVTVEHDLTDESLVFATVARGAKAGGFNATAIDPANRVFGPEFNWTYELGTKNTLADGRITLNASVFYTDWTDIQINSPDPDSPNPNAVNITLNLGDATVYGIELAGRFQATDNLSFDATFSHTEAEYSDGTIDARYARDPGVTSDPPCDDIVCNSNGDIGGNEVERTAPTQVSFGAQWDAPLGDAGDYFIRTDLTWQSNFFADSGNTGVIPSRFLVNGRAGVSVENVDVSLWIRNAFDKKYVSNAFVVLLPFGNTFGEFFGERRSFGVTTKVSF